MPSLHARIVKWLLTWKEQPFLRTPEALHERIKLARATADFRPTDKVKAKCNIEERSSKGFPVFDVTPKSLGDQKPSATLLYLHGGCFLFDIAEPHWDLITELADRLQARITVPIYPLGPEHQLPEMYEMLQPLYDELAAAQTPQAPFWVAGDSAGGTLTLGLTQCALDAGKPVAARMVPISPAVDVRMQNPQMHVVAATRDPWLAIPGLCEALNLFLEGVERDDHRISPITGRLAGLPPMLVMAATDDLLYPDELLFVEKAKAKGCDVKLVVGEGMMHVWPVLSVPESRTARTEIVEYLQQSRST